MARLEELTAEAKARPDDWGVWCRLARILHDGEHRDAALEAVERAEALASDDAAWLEIGAIRAHLGDLSGAAEAWHRATRAPERDTESRAEAYARLGGALVDLGDSGAALLALRVAVRLRPDHALAHARLAEALERAGERGPGLLHAQTATDLDPASSVGWRVRARLARAEGRLEEAIEAARSGVASDANDVEASIELGRLLAEALAAARGPPVEPAPLDEGPRSGGSFTGDLSVFAVPEMLEFLLVQRASGQLHVEADDGTGALELVEGQVAAARAPGVVGIRARLGARGCALPPGAVDDARLPQLVLQSGRLGRQALLDELQRAVQDSLAVMVQWRRGQARFRATKMEGAALELCIDPRWALLDLARRLDESGDRRNGS